MGSSRSLAQSSFLQQVAEIACVTRCFACSSSTASQPALTQVKVPQELRYRIRKQDRVLAGQQDKRELFASVILERYPVCLPDLPPWRQQFQDWHEQWNAWKFKVPKPGWLDCTRQSSADSAEANFRPEPVRTEADEANDIRSLRRNMKSFLYLAVKQGKDTQAPWRLPKMAVEGEETVETAAQRSVDVAFGSTAEFCIIGHQPAAHLDTEQSRTFFMLGVILDGLPELQREGHVQDYAWLSKQELLEAYDGDSDAQQMLQTLTVE